MLAVDHLKEVLKSLYALEVALGKLSQGVAWIRIPLQVQVQVRQI
jgi:hypothetical protein